MRPHRIIAVLFLTALLGLSLTVWLDGWQPGPAFAQGTNSSVVTIRTTQTTAYEGGLATFILERYGGGTGALSVEVKTWEPNAEVDGFQ